MIAVCFACGHEKQAPLILCKRCQVKPISKKDKINSMCLSAQCLSTKNLDIGSKYIRKNNKLPKFHKKVLAKGTELIDALPDVSTDQSQSFDFSNSFFDFQGLKGDQGETIQVHSIGRPKESADGLSAPSNLGNRESTYQVLQWEIGKDITFDQADLHIDDEGNMYIWQRWIGSGWNWKPVSSEEFMRLREMERQGN